MSTPIQASTGRIFICYRREDSADVTGRIYDRLVDHYGPERVFMDVEGIRLGYDFRSEIDKTIKASSIVIVVMGDQWFAQVSGKRRIDNTDDPVRLEIEAALRLEIPIIPVLARKAIHSSKTAFPTSLKPLSYRHGTSIRHEHFHADVDSLISQMDKLLERQESKSSKPAEANFPPEQVTTTQEKAVFVSAETQRLNRPEVIETMLRKVPRWVWAVFAATLLLSGILLVLWKRPPGESTPRNFGDLRIESQPSGADLALDGGSTTKTPHTFKDLSFGTHRLTITLEGYSPVERNLQFNGANPPMIVLEPKPKPPEEIAKLSVRSDPPGAVVHMDGTPPQEPPNTFTRVRFGKHKLTASLDGYEPKEQELTVDRATATEVILRLDQSKPTPTPTPKPSPTPTATPKPLPTSTPPSTPAPDPVKELIGEIKRYERAQDWPKQHLASLLLVQRLTTSGEPTSTEHKEALQVAMAGLRTKGKPALSSEEFRAYEENIKYAAHLDILPAILILADDLKDKKSPEAFDWYYYAADKRLDPEAMTRLAWLYFWGECGQHPDKESGFKWFKQAYQAGSIAAGTFVAECYLRGEGTAKDEGAGIHILRSLAKGGVAHANTLLGQCYYNGFGDSADLPQAERDQKAKAYFEQAVAAGDWAACGHLGVLYENGRGTPKDWKAAVKLYLKGVENQNPICMYYYARALENHGPEIRKIFSRADQAATYYKKAAAASVQPAVQWCIQHNVKF